MGRTYQPSLDGLRAIAVIAVMGYHLYRPAFTGGSLGVDVFFVLSGYLITSTLITERTLTGRINYGAFLLRRARRLLPALLVMLAVTLALAPLLIPQWTGRSLFDAAVALAYLTNIRQSIAPNINPLSHTWSLAIEEQFYLVFPLVVLALGRLAPRRQAQVLYAAWAAMTLARWATILLWPGAPAAYYATPLHATGLLLGAAIAVRPPNLRYGRLGLVLIVGLALRGVTSLTFPVTVMVAELAAAAVIVDPPRLLRWKPLVWIGLISYGVYLWHVPVEYFLDPLPLAARAPASAGLAIGLAAASYYLLERRFLAANRRASSPSIDPRVVGDSARSVV